MTSESAAIAKVRIFVSSPGDVAEERNVALSAIRELQAEFQGRLDLVPILWEQMPLLASAGFQEEIDRRAPPSKTDLALFILWSRLGTPLSEDFVLEDGRRPTGTEWEFADASRAHGEQGTPHILAYRRLDPPRVEVNDPRYAERQTDWSTVQAFFDRHFRAAQDLSFTGAYHSFHSPSEFGQKLRGHLRDELRERVAGRKAEATWHGSPFRGLEPFETEHARIFFGRRRAIEEVRQALSRQIRAGRAFVLIVGASGNGKSSLARAGLLPRLTGPWVAEEDVTTGFCRQVIVRPGDGTTPLVALAQALARHGSLPDLTAQGSAEALARAWARSPEAAVNDVRGALVREARTRAGADVEVPPGRLVLLVDQLEETFTREGVGEQERKEFADVLDALCRSGFVWVLATLRSDFYPALLGVAVFKALEEGDGRYLLEAPDEEEVAEIVRLPAELAGLSYEREEDTGRSLDAVLISEARKGKDALPLLQYALMLLERDKRPDGQMTFAAYQALGGIEGAIGRQADATWKTLGEASRAAFPRVLRALVDVAEGSELRATARRARKTQVTPTPGARAFVKAFEDARLLVADGEGEEAVVSVAHEALLRRWERAAGQIAAEAELLRIQTRLRAEAARWDGAGRAARWEFWRGRDLEGALLLPGSGFDLEERERAYLAAAERQARRVRLLKRVAIVAIAVLAVGASLLALFALDKQREAEGERDAKATALVREQEATGRAEQEARAKAAALTAVQQERDAKGRALDDVLRLADSKKVADLVAEVDLLWPLEPERSDAMATWIESVKTVLGNREGHRERLELLRTQALPYTEEERVRDRAREIEEIETLRARLVGLDEEHGRLGSDDSDEAAAKRKALEEEAGRAKEEITRLEAEVATRKTFAFASEQDAWMHQVFTDLLAGLDRLDGGGEEAGGALARVATRHAFVTTLRARSVEEHEVLWRETIEGIAASPKYGGLRITPQLGLLPLGPDSDSGLFEFAHVGSGSVPKRNEETKRFEDADDTAIALVLIPGGTFRMGAQKEDPDGPNYDPEAEGDESPVHEVTLSPFFLAKHEVTQAQWKVMTEGLDPSSFKAGQTLGDKPLTPRNPVEQVSWEDCNRWLTRNRLLLPAEAQWEYACRAGTDTPWVSGREVGDLGKVANIADAWLKGHGGAQFTVTPEVDDGHAVHAPVGSFAANGFGLHDMHGNVYEWCRDVYASGAYAQGPRTDPMVESGSGSRVYRGGSWGFVARTARSAYRGRIVPGNRNYDLGVRPARPVTP